MKEDKKQAQGWLLLEKYCLEKEFVQTMFGVAP